MLVDISRELHQAEEDEFNRVCGTSGWKLHNTGKMTPNVWNSILDIIGHDNYHIQTMSTGNFSITPTGTSRTQEWVRGYILISPAGLENLFKDDGK